MSSLRSILEVQHGEEPIAFMYGGDEPIWPPYPVQVMRDHPVAYFRMAERSGNIYRDLMGGPNGTLGGNVAGQQRRRGSLLPNGESRSTGLVLSNTMNVPSPTPALGAGNYTFECFVRWPSGAVAGGTLFSTVTPSGARVQMPSSTTLRIDAGGVESDPVTVASISQGTPTYLVATVNGTTATWYRNGYPVNTWTLSARGNISAANGFSIGPFNVWWQEVAIYNYALTAAQVENHWMFGQEPYASMILRTPDVERYWPLGQQFGIVTPDHRGDNDATASGVNFSLPDRLPGSTYPAMRAGSITAGSRASDYDTKGLSAEFWYRARNGEVTLQQCLMQTGMNIVVNSSGQLAVRPVGANTSSVIISPGVWNDDQWKHVVVTMEPSSPSRIALHVNGQLIVDGTPNVGPPSGSVGWRVFGQWTGSMPVAQTFFGFTGFISHCAIYERVLTQNEIQEHYSVGSRQL